MSGWKFLGTGGLSAAVVAALTAGSTLLLDKTLGLHGPADFQVDSRPALRQPGVGTLDFPEIAFATGPSMFDGLRFARDLIDQAQQDMGWPALLQGSDSADCPDCTPFDAAGSPQTAGPENSPQTEMFVAYNSSGPLSPPPGGWGFFNDWFGGGPGACPRTRRNDRTHAQQPDCETTAAASTPSPDNTASNANGGDPGLLLSWPLGADTGCDAGPACIGNPGTPPGEPPSGPGVPPSITGGQNPGGSGPNPPGDPGNCPLCGVGSPTPLPTPEPAGALIFAAGLAGLVIARRNASGLMRRV